MKYVHEEVHCSRSSCESRLAFLAGVTTPCFCPRYAEWTGFVMGWNMLARQGAAKFQTSRVCMAR